MAFQWGIFFQLKPFRGPAEPRSQFSGCWDRSSRDKPKPSNWSSVCEIFPPNPVSVMKGWLASKQTLPGDLLPSIRKDWVHHHIHLLRFTMSISDDSLEYILGSCVGKVKAIELIMASGSIWLLDRTFPSCWASQDHQCVDTPFDCSSTKAVTCSPNSSTASKFGVFLLFFSVVLTNRPGYFGSQAKTKTFPVILGISRFRYPKPLWGFYTLQSTLSRPQFSQCLDRPRKGQQIISQLRPQMFDPSKWSFLPSDFM